MIVALDAARLGRFISTSLADDCPVTRARVETTESFANARRFADAAALTAYLSARGESAGNWIGMTLP